MSIRPAVMRRLIRELAQLKSEPPEGIRVSSPDDNMLDVTGIIEGPSGTPYEGGYFRVKFKFTEEFPSAPPKCWFATKIFHPNVSSSGEICVNTLKKDWQSSYGIGHILVTVKCLLIYPNPESALDEEAGKLLLENYESYCERARLITKVHATPKVRPAEFSNSSSQIAPSTSASEQKAPTLDVPPVHTLLSTSSPSPNRKSASPSPIPAPAAPLQSSNTLPTSLSKSSVVSDSLSTSESVPTVVADKAPLGKADSNSPSIGNTANTSPKAIKRPANSGSGAAEKRKKALKRL